MTQRGLAAGSRAALNTQTLYRASVVAGDNFRTGTRQIDLQCEQGFDPQRTWKIGTGLKLAS